MKPITAVLTIAGTKLVLTGCEDPQSKQSARSIFQAFGATDLVSQAAVPAAVAYVEVEPEPPAPVWEEVCWIELHRAGTMEVRVCENRIVSP